MSRKHFTTSLDEGLLKSIKKLAIDLDRTVNDLLEEGIRYLLTKHGKAGEIMYGKVDSVDPSQLSSDGTYKRVVRRRVTEK